MISCHLILDRAFEDLLHTDGTSLEFHLFVCPLIIASHSSRSSLALGELDHYYWAMDPEGHKQLSLAESDSLGLPRLVLEIRSWATFWEPYHYNAVREFHRGKGFDPGTQDVTQLLSLPIVEILEELR